MILEGNFSMDLIPFLALQFVIVSKQDLSVGVIRKAIGHTTRKTS